MRAILIAMTALAALAACTPASAPQDGVGDAPALVDPSSEESGAARTLAAANAAAEALTGRIEVSNMTRMPDAGANAAAPREVIALTGANGYVLEAELVGAASPAMMVDGQTLRGLLSLPVEASQTLVYRVSREEKDGRPGLCGADAPDFVVIWDSENPAAPALKALGLRGGQPGEEGARACAMLEYRPA